MEFRHSGIFQEIEMRALPEEECMIRGNRIDQMAEFFFRVRLLQQWQ